MIGKVSMQEPKRCAPAVTAEILLESGPACHWVLDSHGVFQQAFGKVEGLFRFQLSDLPGRALSDALSPAALAAWKPHLDEALGSQVSFIAEDPERDSGVWAVRLFPLKLQAGEAPWLGGLSVNVTESQVAERELRSTALRLLQSQDNDHARISRFLHDEVGQSLTAVGMQLDILRMDLEPSTPGIAQRTAEIQEILEGVVGRIRDLSYELNPAIVERAGFQSALDRLAGRCRRQLNGTFRLLSDSSLRIPTEVGDGMYRIAGEATQNAIQHSGCTQIELLVKSTREGPALEVRDNGRGFVPAAGRRLGLMLMEHYAARSGLRLEIDSRPGQGTTVRAIWARSRDQASR